MAEENTQQETVDLSGIGAFDFTPDWAKGKSDDKSRYARFDPDEEGRGRSEPRRGYGEKGRSPARQRDMRGDMQRRETAGRGTPAFGQQRREDGRGNRPFRREARPFVRPLDADVRILPNQKDLGAVIRKIQTSHLAYPLRQLERLFLDNPAACMLRVAPRGEAAGHVHFHQCKACGAVAFSEDELMAHLIAVHLGDYWQAEEVECEPPKGAFSCVAKCGLSGELLGPPNLHGYEARIAEMIRTRYPQMSESDYRSHIEMVRDQETVEAWRKSATKKTVFRKKGETEAPAVEREAAEMEFRRQIAPALMSAPKAVDVQADLALKASDRAFVFACRDAIEMEKRRPRNLSFALHGAFHHRKLEFFRANDVRGPEFVVAAKPTPLDTTHAIPALSALVKYVEEHGEVTRAELLATLAGDDAQKAADLKLHIAWLVEKGHLVGFSDGLLAAPAKFPRHTPQKQRKPAAGPQSAPDALKQDERTAPAVEQDEPKQMEESQEEIKEEVRKDETADQLAE